MQHRARTAIWVPGLATLVGSWAYAAMVAGLAGVNELAIPLAGPWIDLANHPGNPKRNQGNVALGSVQAIGLGVFLTGLLWDNPRYVRSDLAGIHVSPSLGPNLAGASVSGRF